MPNLKDDPKCPEWRPYIFARDQWHCRICGDRFQYSEAVRKQRRACAPRTHTAEYVRILQGRSLAPKENSTMCRQDLSSARVRGFECAIFDNNAI
jgi:hypothetical protein